MRRLSRRQVVALVGFAVWAVLLTLGLTGGSISIIPRPLTQAAGLIAIVALAFAIPAWLLTGLTKEQGVQSGGSSLAIRWRWRMAFWGPLMVIVGTLLLVPTTRTAAEIRIFGGFVLVYGVLYVWIAVLVLGTESSSRC